jgi:Na+-driven multidrug efflux pump
MTILGIVIFIFSPQIIEVFVPNSPKINELWTEMVRTSALFLWLIWIQMTLMWAMRAIWKTWIPMFITIFWIWFVIPIIYYFANYEVFGLNLWEKAIWWGNVLQMFIIVILVILVMLKINWYKINITKHEEYIN